MMPSVMFQKIDLRILIHFSSESGEHPPRKRRDPCFPVQAGSIEGEIHDDLGSYPVGSWLRIPDRGDVKLESSEGCTLYVKLGAVPSLRSTA